MSEARNLRVLMVDDDPADVAILGDYLEGAPFDITLEAVHDGESALKRLAAEPPLDLILLDLNMPRMSGHEVLDAMQRDANLPPVPVIVLTTSSRDEDIERSFGNRASGFVTKPHDAAGFEALIQLIEDFAKAYVW